MEGARQEDQENSAAEHATGNPFRRLPADSPDEANPENIPLPVDQVVPAGDLEPLTQSPETESLENAADCQESKAPELPERVPRSEPEKTETGCNLSPNGNQAEEMVIQEVRTNPDGQDRRISTEVLVSSSQNPESPRKMDHPKNVTDHREPKNEDNQTDCDKLKSLELTSNDDRSNSTENRTESNVLSYEDQACGFSTQDASSAVDALNGNVAQKMVTDKSSLTLELQSLNENYNNNRDGNPHKISRSTKPTLNKVHPSPRKINKPRCKTPEDDDQAAGFSMEGAASFAGEAAGIRSTIEDDPTIPSRTSWNSSKPLGYNFQGPYYEAVSVDLSEPDDAYKVLTRFELREGPRTAQGSERDSRRGRDSGFVATPTVQTPVRRFPGGFETEFPQPSDLVQVYIPGGGRQSRIIEPDEEHVTIEEEETLRGPSTRCNRNLCRYVMRRLCCCFTKCKWFPKMCSCLESSSGPLMSVQYTVGARHGMSYERLGGGSNIFGLGGFMQRARRFATSRSDQHIDLENQEEVRFYYDDLMSSTVWVERNLRAIDLCELLKVKRNVVGIAWSIVESWPELGIARTLEDDEDVLATWREMKTFPSGHDRKFYFREDPHKYEFFTSPKTFFGGLTEADEEILRSYLCREDSDCPQVFSEVWMRDEASRKWRKTHLSLKGRKLFTTKKALQPTTEELRARLTPQKAFFLETTSSNNLPSPDHSSGLPTSPSSICSRTSDGSVQSSTGAIPKQPRPSPRHQVPLLPEQDPPTTYAHLSDYVVYNISNARKYFSAPSEWGLCLRPANNAEVEDTVAGVPGLKVIAFTSEKASACWLAAMRLAKYGKQLRENYRAFRNKQVEPNGGGSTKEQYNSYNVPNVWDCACFFPIHHRQNINVRSRSPISTISEAESLRSRVAMDFTGSVGRIVDDPKEAKDIAENEGQIWRRRWRPFSRPPPGLGMVKLQGLDGGIHVLQPWFHSGLNRDMAAAIIKEHGTTDGVFLVRESKSNPGAYVLTYKYNEKIFHAQIQPMQRKRSCLMKAIDRLRGIGGACTIFDERRGCWLFTLDKGQTKFYDLLQLIEFYQLNSGSLPMRLTNYVQNGVTIAQQRQEDRGASPSPPLSGNQNLSPKSSSGI